MTYRGKYPHRIAMLSGTRQHPGAMIAQTNAGEAWLIYGRENTAPLKPGAAPALGDEIAIYNRHPLAGGEMVPATMARPAKGSLVREYVPGAFGVRLYKAGERYGVQYGFQLREGLSYEGAMQELGACLMHETTI